MKNTLIAEVEGSNRSYYITISKEVAQQISILDLSQMREVLLNQPPAMITNSGMVDVYLGHPEDTDPEEFNAARLIICGFVAEKTLRRLSPDEATRAAALMNAYNAYVETHGQDWPDCRLVADEDLGEYQVLQQGEIVVTEDYPDMVALRVANGLVTFPAQIIGDDASLKTELAKGYHR